MGRERTVETKTETQTTPQATPEEQRLQQLEIERVEATQPGMIGAQTAGLNLVQQLLKGQEPLPGFFEQLAGGISPEVTSEIAQEAVRDIMPSFQQAGIIDSGVAASIAGRTAGDIRRATQEFNLGQKLNLLNLALSGQAQVQTPILAQSQMLGARLAGLRPVTQTGYTNQTQSFNPFMENFMGGVGSTIGTFGIQKGGQWSLGR